MTEHVPFGSKTRSMFEAILAHAAFNPGSRVAVMAWNSREVTARRFLDYCETVPHHITVQQVMLHPEYVILLSNRSEVQFFNVEEVGGVRIEEVKIDEV